MKPMTKMQELSPRRGGESVSTTAVPSLPGAAMAWLMAAALFTVLSAPATTTLAQSQNESTVQGTVGLGMVGAEAGLVFAGLVDETWAYIAFPIVAGAGGAVGGYFLFDEPNRVEGSVAMLATGMALLIPSVVLSLVLAADDPGDDLEEGEVVGGRTTLRDLIAAGPGLFRFAGGSFRLAPPGVSVGALNPRAALHAEDAGLLDVIAASEAAQVVHVPLVSGAL